MAVAYDSVGPAGGGGAGVGTPPTLTWTHTTIGASTTILAACAPDNIATTLPATCTCDGVSMTSLGTIASGSGGTSGFLQAFYINSISAGAHTITVTYDLEASDCTGGSIAYTGVTGLGTVYTSSTTKTVVDTSNTSGNIIAGFFAAGNTITQASGNATGRFLNNLEGGGGASVGNIAGADAPATGASVTITWTTGSTSYCSLGLEVQGAQGAQAGPPLNQGLLPNFPAVIVTSAGWRDAGHSR